MLSRAATFPHVGAYDVRPIAVRNYRRAALSGAVLGLGSVSAVALMAGTVAVAAAWMVAGSLGRNPALRAGAPFELATMSLPRPPQRLAAPADMFGAALASANPAYGPDLAREDRLGSMASDASLPMRSPHAPTTRIAALTENVPLPPPRPLYVGPNPVKTIIFRAPPAAVPAAPPQAVEAHAPPPMMAVPRVQPTPPETRGETQRVAALAEHSAAAVTGSIEMPARREAPQLAYNNPEIPAGADSHTAIYDIVAHTVYLPDGERLEAHSGLGRMLDDPRYVSAKARGPTPPNVYHLTLRSGLFHGVQALRLNPAADSRMYGRDGILAHTYMLGPSGQSFGCVSFKHYSEFLRAFQRGEINRLVVVAHLQSPPPGVRADRDRGHRYAFDLEGAH